MVSMSTMKDGLRSSRFLFNMEKKFPIDYVEMLTRIEKYANAEEAMAARRDSLTSRAKKENKRKKEESSDRDRPIRPRDSSRYQPQKFHEHTLLRVPQS